MRARMTVNEATVYRVGHFRAGVPIMTLRIQLPTLKSALLKALGVSVFWSAAATSQLTEPDAAFNDNFDEYFSELSDQSRINLFRQYQDIFITANFRIDNMALDQALQPLLEAQNATDPLDEQSWLLEQEMAKVRDQFRDDTSCDSISSARVVTRLSEAEKRLPGSEEVLEVSCNEGEQTYLLRRTLESYEEYEDCSSSSEWLITVQRDGFQTRIADNRQFFPAPIPRDEPLAYVESDSDLDGLFVLGFAIGGDAIFNGYVSMIRDELGGQCDTISEAKEIVDRAEYYLHEISCNRNRHSYEFVGRRDGCWSEWAIEGQRVQ